LRRHERAGNLPCVRTWLTKGGVTSAIVVGAGVLAGSGTSGFALLLVFFVTSSALTRGDGRRRATQVFANGGVAAACALLSRWHPAMLFAFAGALAAAAADTWSTEIGARSGRPPRLVTTWREVPVGTSGGVTLLGSAGGIAGSATIGLASLLLLPIGRSGAAWIVLGGAAGALVDSLLGATLQARWRCPACGAVMETRRHGCGAEGTPERGIMWLDNDAVNVAATLVGAAIALAAASGPASVP
jgi:uncharacterized protein (TIGR00297 family)